MNINERLAELRDIGEEEDITPSDQSELDLRTFSASFGDPAAIFLLDNGNYRARWYNSLFSVAVEFKGNGDMHILHLPRSPFEGEK